MHDCFGTGSCDCALLISMSPMVQASATIYIRADGSIDPVTANITSSDNVMYVFTDDNYDSLVVQKSNVTVDGAGYALRGV